MIPGAKRSGADHCLSPLRLFQHLLVNAGHTLPTERLLEHVWGYAASGDRQRLKQLVHRLRRQLERNPAAPRYRLTVAGTGYLFQTGGVQ